jgi:DNA-directed RNA polymerase specialized sigma24 family protein
MTLEYLRSYKSKKEEIDELAYKLDHIADDDNLVGNDVIFDYRSGYPQPQAVVGTDQEKYHRLSRRWRNRKTLLEEECLQVEEFVESISDSLTRRIFRMCYLDGYTQKQVADKMNLDRSTVTKKIDKYLKVSPNSPKKTL